MAPTPDDTVQRKITLTLRDRTGARVLRTFRVTIDIEAVALTLGSRALANRCGVAVAIDRAVRVEVV